MAGFLRYAVIFILALPLLGGLAKGEAQARAARAENLYTAAKTNYEAHPSDPEAVIKFAHAASDLADFATSDAQCFQVAQEGITATRSLISRDPTNAAAHYFLAQNLGKIANIKRMSALGLVSEMETELLAAYRLDPKLDYAGPDRCLGLIYQDAPGWPLSIGSRKKAQQRFLNAVELCPDYPDNRLCLIEAAIKWGNRSFALQQYAILKTNWTPAKLRYSGEDWTFIWSDWEARWDIIQTKLGKKDKKG